MILKVTALFLGLFLLQLVIYGVHELAGSGVIKGTQAFHDATELLGPTVAWVTRSLTRCSARRCFISSGLAAPPRHAALPRRLKSIA